jgi:nucleotide-binding universal stress UspA family protein
MFETGDRLVYENIVEERDRLKRVAIGAQVFFKNILVPADFSECSCAAMPYAFSIARQYGSKLFVTHVMSSGKENPRYVVTSLSLAAWPTRELYEQFAQFLVERGIDSISLNPDSVLKTLVDVATTEQTLRLRGNAA